MSSATEKVSPKRPREDDQESVDKVPHQRLLNKVRAHGIEGGYINGLERGLVTGNRGFP